MMTHAPKRPWPAFPDRVRMALSRWFAVWDAGVGHPYLRWNFRRAVGYPLELDSPHSFNAKMQWRKLHDRNPLFPVLVDKLKMREHVAAVLGRDMTELFPELLLVTDDPEVIDLGRLPPDIAIKANHGCGWNILLRSGDRPDPDEVRSYCRSWLRRTYGRISHEWAYGEVSPRILVERLQLTPDGRLADDLKFMMFGEVCAFVGWAHDRQGACKRYYATSDWRPLPFRMRNTETGPLPPKPAGFAEMLEIARRLGRGLDHLRVDFLHDGEGFRIGELTIYHGGGTLPFDPPEFDLIFGDMWQLPGGRA